MKTNQVMEVSILGGKIKIGHKDMFGSLVDLFQVGNAWRIQNGLKMIRHDKWLALDGTKNFIERVSKEIDESAIRSKRGKGGGIWAHLYVLIDAAAYLHPDLKLEIYKMFVENKILEWRDRSGNNFIELNAAVALNAEEVFGEPAHKKYYIQLANIIRNRCQVSTWNIASPDQLKERARIEEALATMLKAGVVNDWQHLQQLAHKV